jgi:hypothetical protein
MIFSYLKKPLCFEATGLYRLLFDLFYRSLRGGVGAREGEMKRKGGEGVRVVVVGGGFIWRYWVLPNKTYVAGMRYFDPTKS